MHAPLFVSLVAMLAQSASDAPAAHWQAVLSAGRKIGQIEQTRRVEGERLFESENLTLELGGPGRRHTYQLRIDTESTLDGRLVRLLRESKTRAGHERVEARVTGDELIVDIGAGGRRHTRTLPGARELRTDEVVRRWVSDPGRPLRYRTFDSAKLAVADVELRLLERAGDSLVVSRTTRVAGSETVGRLTLDARGNVIDEGMRLGGLELRLTGTTEALARGRNEALDHVGGQLQRSPYRIPARDMRAKIRYGFDHQGRAPNLPSGAGQRSWSDDRTTWIQVCASCPLDPAPLTEAERVAALAPTPWLNFEDPAFKARALRIAGSSRNAVKKMQVLSEHVRELMSSSQIDMLGYGSALEAFRSRRGDCTEYAVLLAAMGRAAGIPTRVVSGLVYARRFEGRRHVFVPHMWVQAWDGTTWRSFDAGIGSFDSTHLAFAMSYDANPAQMFGGLNLAHELKLRSAARVVAAKN